MRLKRLLGGLASVAVGLAATLVFATPARAAIVCESSIELYKNNYEVVATQNAWCNTGSPLIVVAISFTKPVYKSRSAGCPSSRTCSVTIYTTNLAGLQEYCVKTGGQYQERSGNPAGTSRPFPRETACTTA